MTAGPFKVLSAFGSHWCSPLPPFDKKKKKKNHSSAGRWCCRSLLVVPCATTGAKPRLGLGEEEERKKGATRLVENYARSWRGVAGKLNWCRERKYRRVSAVCFPNSYHAHRAERERETERGREREGERDGLRCWDEQDGRADRHKSRSNIPKRV